MKKWIAAGSVLLLVALSLAFTGHRQSGFGMPHGIRGPQSRLMSHRILALLDNDQFRSRMNLTDGQASRLRQIVVAAEKSAIETRAQMTVDGIELREMLRGDKPDQDAVMKKVEQISRLRGKMMKDGVQSILEARSVLTPEQQKKLREFMGSRLSRGDWGGRWRDHRRGTTGGPQGLRNKPPLVVQPRQ